MPIDLTNREIAVAMWILIATALALSQENIRKSLGEALASFFQTKVFLTFLLMAAYIGAILFYFSRIGLWDLSLIKETVLWFFFVGVPLAFSSFASRSSELGFRDAVLDSIRFTVLVEFIINFFVFSLPVELILVPFVTLVLAMRGYVSAKEEYSQIDQLLMWVQAIVGLVIISYVVWQLFSGLGELISMQSAKEILVAPLMTVLLLPFIYVVMLLLSYESLFVVLKAGPNKDDSLLRYVKRKLIFHLGFSVGGIRRFHQANGFKLIQVQSRNDLDELLGSIDDPDEPA